MPVASADTLMGLGLPAQLAQLLGGNSSQLTCVGTTQGSGPVIKSTNTELVVVAGQTACILPATPDNSNVMVPYNIVNPAAGANAALVFVPVGHTAGAAGLNGNLNGGTGIPQNKSMIAWQYKPKFWAFVLSA